MTENDSARGEYGQDKSKPVQVNTKLSPERHAELEARAAEAGVKPTQYVRNLIDADLDGRLSPMAELQQRVTNLEILLLDTTAGRKVEREAAEAGR